MFHLPSFDPHAPAEVVSAGEVLRHRHQPAQGVLYLESGSVLLGVCEGPQMRHQIGAVEGPAWLDAAFVLAGQPCCVDLVADERVRLRRVALDEFLHAMGALPAAVRALVHDMARAYCSQTETVVSRLAQDAEARCAQWLLRHAQRDGNGTLCVTLRQRKRLIAAQLGIAPETFSRVLRHLREHGLIAGTGTVLNLPHPSALEMVAAS